MRQPLFYEDYFPAPMSPVILREARVLAADMCELRTGILSYRRLMFYLVTFRQKTIHILKEGHTVSRAKRSTQTDGQGTAARGNVEWVNVSLPDEVAAAMEQFYGDESVVAQWVLVLATRGQQLFVKRQGESGSFMAGFIAEHPDYPGVLMGVTGWSDNPYDALRSLLYKWFQVLCEEWPEPGQAFSQRFR
jgi:hypothetical protein